MEGQKLKQDGDAFRSKLNTQQLFEDWKKRVESRQQAVQGRIFNIVSSRTRSGTILSLQMKIVAEDKVVEQKTTELLQEWEKGKPVQVLTLTVHLLQCRKRTWCERREEKGMKDWEKKMQIYM